MPTGLATVVKNVVACGPEVSRARFRILNRRPRALLCFAKIMRG
jgi:hypothetical protein